MTFASVSKIEIDLNGKAEVTIICVGDGALSGTLIRIEVPAHDGTLADIRRRACTALAIDLQNLTASVDRLLE